MTMETTKAYSNSMVRWEDSASLEHSCWQCPTKANSPRALQTCYGTHSMPCTSYHPTMHAIGAAHRCSGCISTREMHDARHREIAALVAEYMSLETTGPQGATRIPLLERNVNIDATKSNRFDRDAFERVAPGPAFDIHVEESGEEQDDAMSLSSYTPASTDAFATSTKKTTKAEVRARKKAKKSIKSQKKALKNQTRNLASVTSADVDRIAEVLHGQEEDVNADGSAHPLTIDKTIDDVINRNLSFVKKIQAHKQDLIRSVAPGRGENRSGKRLKKREALNEIIEDTAEVDEIASAIMLKLGISAVAICGSVTAGTNAATTAPHRNNRLSDYSSSGRKRAGSNVSVPLSPSVGKGSPGANKDVLAIAIKLRNAIKIDLERHDNEVYMRYVRARGFWKYVGKTVFDRMIDIAAEFDFSTGERWEKKRTRQRRNELMDQDEENDPKDILE